MFYRSTFEMCRVVRFYRTMSDLEREVGCRDVSSATANLQKHIEKVSQTAAEKKLNEAKRG